jgi:hypothetical protein
MSKKKSKVFKYKFLDCEKEFPSSVPVKCTATGETVKMYHKSLVTLIRKNYDNNWKLFESSYVKKGNKSMLVRELDDDESYDTKPERYRQFLIMNFLHYRDNTNLSLIEKNQKMSFYSDCYKKRWGMSLEQLIQQNAI